MHFLATYWYYFLGGTFVVEFFAILNMAMLFRNVVSGKGSIRGFGMVAILHLLLGMIGLASFVVTVIAIVARLMNA